jgi:hypothetical protein
MLQASEELLEQVSESEQASFAPANDRDAAMAGLLAAVVGQIVLAKGGIKKDEFWSLLGEMGVKESDKDHPKLGNIKACMDNLKRQQYLDMVSKKNPVDRTTTVTFHLGARSKQELIRPKMRAFLDGQMGEALDDEGTHARTHTCTIHATVHALRPQFVLACPCPASQGGLSRVAS